MTGDPARCSPSFVTLPDLIRLCLESDNAASWEELQSSIQPVIAAVILRVVRRFPDAPPRLADDLIQETFLRLCDHRCRVLRESLGQPADRILGLLRTIAFNVTMDHCRSTLAMKRGAGKSSHPLDAYAEHAAAGLDGIANTERQILLDEIDRFLSAAGTRPADRHIFWLYYRHGMTLKAIAALPGMEVTQKGVESTIQRLTSRVRGWITVRKNPPPQAKGKMPANP